MKIKVIVFLSIFAIISWNPDAFAAETSLANKPCSKIGMKRIQNGVLFICTKGTKINLWKPNLTTSPSPKTTVSSTPLPTQSPSPFKPLFSLNLTPILTMSPWSQVPGKKSSWIVTPGFVEISIPTFDRINPEAEYFVVIDKNAAYNGYCRSGSETLPWKLRKTSDPTSSRLEERPFSKTSSPDLVSFYFKIPSFPLTFRCEFLDEKPYSVQIYETFTPERLIRATSAKVEFTSPQIRKPEEPSPSPQPSFNTDIRAIPNALCSPEGVSANSAEGERYICRTNVSDGTLRWSK